MAIYLETNALRKLTDPQAVIVFGYTNDTAPHKDYPQNPDNIVYVK